jgi:hypothetical protein
VEAPSPLRYGVFLFLRRADEAIEIVVGQGGKIGKRIHGVQAPFVSRRSD